MRIAYHGRREQPASGHLYCPSPVALARRSDFLVVAVPGGAETEHMVGEEVLRALGPAGFLVNVARGSVVAC